MLRKNLSINLNGTKIGNSIVDFNNIEEENKSSHDQTPPEPVDCLI